MSSEFDHRVVAQPLADASSCYRKVERYRLTDTADHDYHRIVCYDLSDHRFWARWKRRCITVNSYIKNVVSCNVAHDGYRYAFSRALDCLRGYDFFGVLSLRVYSTGLSSIIQVLYNTHIVDRHARMTPQNQMNESRVHLLSPVRGRTKLTVASPPGFRFLDAVLPVEDRKLAGRPCLLCRSDQIRTALCLPFLRQRHRIMQIRRLLHAVHGLALHL